MVNSTITNSRSVFSSGFVHKNNVNTDCGSAYFCQIPSKKENVSAPTHSVNGNKKQEHLSVLINRGSLHENEHLTVSTNSGFSYCSGLETTRGLQTIQSGFTTGFCTEFLKGNMGNINR